MVLSREDAELFYELFFPLLRFIPCSLHHTRWLLPLALKFSTFCFS